MPSNAGKDDTVRAREDSLRRLRTDRLDLYLLHWPGSAPLEETLDAFATLVGSGSPSRSSEAQPLVHGCTRSGQDWTTQRTSSPSAGS